MFGWYISETEKKTTEKNLERTTKSMSVIFLNKTSALM